MPFALFFTVFSGELGGKRHEISVASVFRHTSVGCVVKIKENGMSVVAWSSHASWPMPRICYKNQCKSYSVFVRPPLEKQNVL